jgi:hypothetical protein
MKYGLNKINTRLFKQQVGWFGGKGVQFHPWVQGSNFTNDIVVINDGILIEYSIFN